ncbi:hypothetical protein TSUD_374620 [Trifolium subterraneum]|uniref:Reverse transcriptase zinc-binding domain-containing protein n=1 Tax=Trifolium subterraneum TaxID=3900 RepID=A0A2Z6NVY1_TRISU|nr:hypothetical protein TSUD_374620 [Trifolium subterraneum]
MLFPSSKLPKVPSLGLAGKLFAYGKFNLALLGKWCWRMLVDREGLWFRVLAARYGVEGGRRRVGGRRGSVWWREIAHIREGGETGGRWFGEHVAKRVGDGSDTFFWTDPWVGEIPLCERFGRLFELAETKLCTAAEMCSLGWGVDGEAWVWRRQMRACEEELLRECYTVQGAYHLLTFHDPATMDDAEKLIWHSQVPSKVSILAWRLLRNRLSTKANIVARGILPPTAHFCVSDCGAVETGHHLFISCSTFGSLWVDLGRIVPYCNSFGLLVFGLYGRKEIIDSSEAQHAVLIICWTRSGLFLLGG